MSLFIVNSSIGRKLIMSITGLALVLFLTFHAIMNLFVIISPEVYDQICHFLGANWYAIVGTMGLAFLFVVHILYAFWLSLQNYLARGKDRYAVTKKAPGVDWASQNMLVLGIIVFGFLALHLYNFWYKMQLQEILGTTAVINGQSISPTDGAFLIRYTFSQWYYVLAYVVWLAALWFHLSHGFWSMFHSVGWSGSKWLGRWQVIGNIYVTLLVLGFLSVVLFYFFKSIF
ncbi:MAG TPA: succinate dehydrogenase/fumarate reductase cytochrome b subunit [Bacteroidales bacterium]|nr:succinate dehydrogenase/fumarate reductase cytochrome b subunit [Bacteroidales bacterium]